MKINWKLRFKNKAVLTGLVSAVLMFIKQVTELFGVDLSTQIEQVSGIVGTVLMILTGLGIITDPTTKGVADSGIVQTYDKPRDSKNEDEQVEWKSIQIATTPEINSKEPEEFDTSKEFTDDSNDVGFNVHDYDDGGDIHGS